MPAPSQALPLPKKVKKIHKPTDNLVIAQFGFGTVGRGFYNLLQDISAPHIHTQAIVVKHPTKPRPITVAPFLFDAMDTLDNADINTLVELIDDADAAYNIVSKSLAQGKNVVTANKKMLAYNLPAFIKQQQKNDSVLLYEASACGSIPIIRNIETYFAHEHIMQLNGIFNGTCNYIVTQMAIKNESFADALRGAQISGFAESDPTLDIEGYDTLNKLVILVVHAFGVYVPPDTIFCKGITALSVADFQWATAQGSRIRLVANAYLDDEDKLHLFVMPQLATGTDVFYNVNNELNSVWMDVTGFGPQVFIGKGAGGNPTGSAVLSDVLAIKQGYKYHYAKYLNDDKPTIAPHTDIRVYARIPSAHKHVLLHFTHVEEIISKGLRDTVVIGTLRIRPGIEKELKEVSLIRLAD